MSGAALADRSPAMTAARPQTVLFDAFELAPGMGNSLGIYAYAKNLLREMLRALPEHIELVVVCNGRARSDFDTGGHPRARTLVLSDRAPSTLTRLAWMLFNARRTARQIGASTYFSPKGFLPFGLRTLADVRSVVVLHDLIPLWYAKHHPAYFGRAASWYINASLLRSARHADVLVVISAATAEDVRAQTGRTANVVVVHNGLPPIESGPAPLAGDYVFALTSDLPHKNGQAILAAYARYRELVPNPLPLVLCGLPDPKQEGVTALRHLPSEQLHGCFQHAKVFMFLSLIEGFGFPPLEAMKHGVPVICSDIASLREVTRGQAVLVDPVHIEAVARALERLLAEPARLEALALQGPHVANSYNWQDCAVAMFSVLEPRHINSHPRAAARSGTRTRP